MGRVRSATIVAVLAVALLLTVAWPPRPALACSCASPTIAETVARNPEVAIAVVRRIDRAGTASGTGQVLRNLHGQLPPQVPLELDSGSSCLPYVPHGSIATLTFAPDGNAWRTVECGMIDPASALTTAFGAIQPDPDATGPAAVALTGQLPGADVVLLDSELRVLALTEFTSDPTEGLVTCGDDLLATSFGDVGVTITRLSLPRLSVVESVPLPGTWDASLSCGDDGRVTAGGRHDLRPGGWVDPDVFGAPTGDSRVDVDGDDLEVAGDRAFVVRRLGPDGRDGTAIDVLDLPTMDARELFSVGFQLHEVSVAPDGRHLAVRGFDAAPVLLIVSADSGAVRARSDGWWMPVAPDGWAGSDSLVLADEDGGGEFGAPPPDLRIVGLDLTDRGRLPGAPPVRAATASTVLRGGHGYEVQVADLGGATHVSPDIRLIGASSGLLIGEVTGGAEPTPLPQPDPAGATTERPAWAVMATAALGALAVAGAGILGWRRSRSSD